MYDDYVLFVAGVPGTGKSTLSRLLSSELNCRVYETSELAISLGVASPDPTGRYTSVLTPEGAETVAKALVRASRKGCIIASTVYPEVLLDLMQFSALAVVLLRLDPRILERRLRERGWPRPKVLENLVAEALNYYHEALWDHRHYVFEVDTTGKSPLETLHATLDLLCEWKPGFHVDWLEDESLTELVSSWLGELDLHNNWLPEGGSI
ncbi:MAG: AAA family ATPase [Desulfurococcales archaeon]|nr:AAA family ATPase [Desulfurococcales archaeon]